MQQNSVGSESLDELQSIKTEFDHVKKLRSAFIEQVPFAKDELEYENLVSVMLNFREQVLAINEESGREVKKDSVAKVIKLLCEKNKVLAEVVEYGRDVLDGLWEVKHQRQKCSADEIQDMHRLIYWLVGEIITEFENFDVRIQRCTGQYHQRNKRRPSISGNTEVMWRPAQYTYS